MSKTRFYGGDSTYHNSNDIHVELYEGKVVAVWFRCQALPFSQIDWKSKERAEELAKMYKDYPMPDIIGLELKDK